MAVITLIRSIASRQPEIRQSRICTHFSPCRSRDKFWHQPKTIHLWIPPPYSNMNYGFVSEGVALKALKTLKCTCFCVAKKQKDEPIQRFCLPLDSLDSCKAWFPYRCICRVCHRKKIHRTDRIHSISYNKLYLSFLLHWAFVREVSLKLYLSYEFFSYDRYDRTTIWKPGLSMKSNEVQNNDEKRRFKGHATPIHQPFHERG